MNIVLFAQDELKEEIPLSDPRIIHLETILGLSRGDAFAAGIVGGNLGRGTLEMRSTDGWRIGFVPTGPAAPLQPITLLLGCPRPPVARRLLRDMSAMGIKHLVLCSTDLNEKSYLGAKLWRDGLWRQALMDGAMQAGSTHVPTLSTALTLGTALNGLEQDQPIQKIALDNSWEAPALSQISINAPALTLAIGPERGWSDAERELLMQQGFTPARLGQRILRTETACAVGVGLVLAGMGV